MPTEMTFDVAVMSDAITKAARVSPSKGAAFDKAAGIMLEANPAERTCIVRSTDLEVSFRQTVPAVEGSGDKMIWRVPSAMIENLLAAYPQGESSTVTFIDRGDDKIRFVCGKSVAAFQTMTVADYPKQIEMKPEDAGRMVPGDELAAKVDQVAWACDRQSAILGGVYIDGEMIVATNGKAMAYVMCEVNLAEPVVAPLEILRSLLKSASDVRLAKSDQRLFLSLDEDTITSTTLVDGEYPKVRNLMTEHYTGSFKAHRMSFVECLQRLVVVLAREEKLPSMTLTLDVSNLTPQIILDMEIVGKGRIQERMDVTTDATENFTICFHTALLQKAVDNARGDFIELDYGYEPDPSQGALKQARLKDTKGFTCILMPKRV